MKNLHDNLLKQNVYNLINKDNLSTISEQAPTPTFTPDNC